MTDRVRKLASRISALEEEFSRREIRDAIKLLEKRTVKAGGDSLFDNDRPNLTSTERRSRKRKPISDERSKAVLDLQTKDPEKFDVLAEFDSLVRRGSILGQLSEITTLGESLTKSFPRKRSRRQAISALMKVLAQKALPEIRKVVEIALSNHRGDDKDADYQKLAHFIITGDSNQSHREQAF